MKTYALILSAFCATFTGYPQPQYDVTILPTFGGSYGIAWDINDAGQVVGEASDSLGSPHPFLWHNGVMTNLGSLAGYGGAAFAINNLGQVVGTSLDANQNARPFLWSNGSMTNLGTIAGAIHCYAFGINNMGHVVGYADSNQIARAFRWQNGTMTDLGTLGGRQYSHAFDIDDAGRIVGLSFDGQDRWRAFVWNSGVMTDLGTLGGQYSQAWAINNANQIVGTARNAANQTRAFLWENGTMIDLGGPGGQATGINDSGWVVGFGAWAFLWKDGTMYNLNDLITEGSSINLMWAHSISNHGHIVGRGLHNGSMRGFLLTPASPTSINATSDLPSEFHLAQNYPNPFNPSTNIGFQVTAYSHIRLSIYDLLGREVATLVNEEMGPGSYETTWDAGGMASGVYIYRLSAGDLTQTRRLLLLK
jgi:probable HAF family extracellular repeat protein